MKFSLDKNEEYTLLTLEESKLDSTIAPELKSEFISLQTTGVKNLILDLSGVKYVDSSGLSAFLTGNRAFRAEGGNFVLVGIQPMVLTLMTITKLDSILQIAADGQEAIDSIRSIEEEDAD